MTKSIFPCLWFDGNAKEAAELYCSIFMNSAITVETPLVVTFELNGNKIMGLNGGPMFTINPSISLFVTCDSVAETNRIWNSLIDGGSEYMPIDTYPWSERYGWLRDKFGMTWQISSTGKNDGGLHIVPSFLFTNARFGQAGAAIDFYRSVFSDSSTNMMVNFPEGDPNAGKVMYSEFSLNQSEMIAMDGPGDHAYSFNEAVSFVVECETQQEIDYYWEKLTEGGEESMCGWLKDKFGVSWQIVPKILAEMMADPGKAPRAIEAFSSMRKIEIEKLKF
ncbi:MAG TPA: VOC family protein [Draconibacterium sp.]|nr:VOC family protein [Draconibacterium sp.]